MTDASREQQITAALTAYHSGPAGVRPTLSPPIRGGAVLEVVELPLNVPVLNPDSFRIAPRLADHPDRELVERDPFSRRAQAVVSDLVRASHRQVEALKESLVDEGQDTPGVITRKGKLVNANTRCVLLRELVDEGRLPAHTTIKVAVLPVDITTSEELQLESVLQKQREYKDEYNLVSELMMIEKLHEGAGMSDAQIAKSLRITRGATRVKALRRALQLMERTRMLPSPPLPLSYFVSERDQTQNWLELLKEVDRIDSESGRTAGDAHIMRWLTAVAVGLDSVHTLRPAQGAWIEELAVGALAESGADGATLATAVTIEPAAPERADTLPGLDLLGEDSGDPTTGDEQTVRQLLNLTLAASLSDGGPVELPGGSTLPASDVLESVGAAVKGSLATLKRRQTDANALNKPTASLAKAQQYLTDALDALEDVIDLAEYEPYRQALAAAAEQATETLELILSTAGVDDDAAVS